MFLQFCPAHVRRHVRVGRLERFSGNRAEGGGDLMVEEASGRLVVGDVTARTLAVAKMDRAGANQIAIVPSQGGHMKRMNQVRERRVSLLPEQRRRSVNDLV